MLIRFLTLVGVLSVAAAAIPASAVEDGDVAYGNTHFKTQGMDFAVGVTHKFLKAAPLQKGSPPGDEWPAHIEFKFPHYFDGKIGSLLNPHNVEEPVIAVYPTTDFASLGWAKELRSLRSFLKKRSSGNGVLAAANELPYLPMPDSAQMLHCHAVYFAFQNGTGIRYITHYAQDIAPYTADCFFYTYQGLTADGKTYISVSFPLYTSLYPKQTPEKFDYRAFEKHQSSYAAAETRKLNVVDINKEFIPSIAQFDRLVSSVGINSNSSTKQQTKH